MNEHVKAGFRIGISRAVIHLLEGATFFEQAANELSQGLKVPVTPEGRNTMLMQLGLLNDKAYLLREHAKAISQIKPDQV